MNLFIDRGPVALACAVMAAWAIPAHAADNARTALSSPNPPQATVAELRQQIQDMREQYEARLRALEARIQQLPDQASVEPAPLPGEALAKPSSSSNGFNPAAAVILSGTYAHLQRDPSTWQMTGFHTGASDVGPGVKGFSLGESELTLSANVDPWWFGALTVAFTPENKVSVEEAFVQTTALSDGVALKVGRFLSGIGYLNEHHAHTWDFVDAPLAYQAFLGGQLKQEGLQARWLLPTERFMEVAAELGRGAGGHNGAGSAALMAHVGGDIGLSQSWRAGVSHLWTHPDGNTWQTSDTSANAFAGRSQTWMLDGIWKWAPNGNASRTNLKLQGEYFRRRERGTVVAGLDPQDAAVMGHPDSFASAQSGWYLQAVYQFMPRWRVGLRQDELDPGDVDYASNNAVIDRPGQHPKRTSLMLDWSQSEFSRWRAQLNQDQSRLGERDTQFYLQYQMSLGAHGAHGF